MSDPRRDLARRSVIGVAWTGLSLGGLAVAEIVALVILARLLSPATFGLYTASLIIVKFSQIFSGLGIAPAIVQRPVLEVRHHRVGFTLSVLFSLAVAGLVWITAPGLEDVLRADGLTPVVRASSVVFVFQGISMVAQASAQRALRFRWLAGVDAAAFAFGFVVVGPALAWLGLGIWALVGALITQHFLRMLVLLVGQPHPKRPLLEWRAMRELLYFGSGFTLARIFNYLASQADKLVVSRWLGAQTLGLYGLASQFMTAPATLFGQILDRVLFPTMALVQEEPLRLIRAYRSGVAACALVILPVSGIVITVAPEFVQVVLGPNWEGVVAPITILALGMLFRTSYKLSDSVARATGAVYQRAWRQGVYAAAVAIGGLVGQFWGVTGVAWGVVAAITLNFLLMAQLSLRVTGMQWSEFGAAHLPGIALALVIWPSAWALADGLRDLQLPPFAVLIDVVALATAESLVLCWLLPAVFLGRDGQAVLRILASIAPAGLRRRRPG